MLRDYMLSMSYDEIGTAVQLCKGYFRSQRINEGSAFNLIIVSFLYLH